MDWPVDSLWTDKPPTACPPPSPHHGAFAHKLHSAYCSRSNLLIGVPLGVRGKAPHIKGPGAVAPAGAGCPGILDGLGGGAGEAGGGAEAARP